MLRHAEKYVWPARETKYLFIVLCVFLEELGGRLKRVMGEANARSYLYQRLSMAVQRENAASIMGTISPSSDLADFFFF